MADEAARLYKLSVKELRRQAAIKNVPLTQISAAVEKRDLINLIVRAGPVLDTYDVQMGVKIHSASTIAGTGKEKAQKKKKKKPRRKGRGSSSSSSCSSASRRSRGKRRRKRSKSRRRSASRKEVRKARPKSRSSSPSLTIITPPVGNLQPLPGLKALPGPEAPGKAPPTLAQRGMAAAAALGFDVLPKAPGRQPSAPAEGLRPSINSCAPVPYGTALAPGGRICIQYLCTSKCDLGGNCPEAHILDPEEEMRVRARFKEQECHYGAQCSRPGCLFRHPGERIEEGQFIPEGQQVALRATPQGMQLDFR